MITWGTLKQTPRKMIARLCRVKGYWTRIPALFSKRQSSLEFNEVYTPLVQMDVLANNFNELHVADDNEPQVVLQGAVGGGNVVTRSKYFKTYSSSDSQISLFWRGIDEWVEENGGYYTKKESKKGNAKMETEGVGTVVVENEGTVGTGDGAAVVVNDAIGAEGGAVGGDSVQAGSSTGGAHGQHCPCKPNKKPIWVSIDQETGFIVTSLDVADICFNCRYNYRKCDCHLGCSFCKDMLGFCFCSCKLCRQKCRLTKNCSVCMVHFPECHCRIPNHCKWCHYSAQQCRKACIKKLPSKSSSISGPYLEVFAREDCRPPTPPLSLDVWTRDDFLRPIGTPTPQQDIAEEDLPSGDESFAAELLYEDDRIAVESQTSSSSCGYFSNRELTWSASESEDED